MDIEIRVQCVFSVPFVQEQIDVLTKLAQVHYDHKCKSAPEEGGFIAKWQKYMSADRVYRDTLTENDDPFTVSATFSELDTCLKILEVANLAYHSKLISQEAMALCTSLTRDFRGVLSLANQKYREWQITYKVVDHSPFSATLVT